jgi:BMFP domain-containing protein YqiC
MDTLQKENEMLKEQLRMKAVLEAENEALKTRVATLEAKQKEIEANHAFAPVHFNVL